MVKETWIGTFGKRKFIANGEVQDEEGNEYRVHLKGDTIRHDDRDIWILVKGELNGDEESFKLQYITVLKHRHPRVPIYQ